MDLVSAAKRVEIMSQIRVLLVGGAKRQSDSRYILKIELMGFVQLNYCCALLAVR